MGYVDGHLTQMTLQQRQGLVVRVFVGREREEGSREFGIEAVTALQDVSGRRNEFVAFDALYDGYVQVGFAFMHAVAHKCDFQRRMVVQAVVVGVASHSGFFDVYRRNSGFDTCGFCAWSCVYGFSIVFSLGLSHV